MIKHIYILFCTIIVTAVSFAQDFSDDKLKEIAMTSMIQQQLGMLNMDPEQIADLQKRMALSDSLTNKLSPDDGVNIEEAYIAEVEQNEENLVDNKVQIITSDFSGQRYTKLLFSDENAALFAATSNQVSGDYPLKAGDKLVLNVWGVEFKEYTLTLDNSGNVMMPNIGRVSLNGLTLARAERLLKKKLENSNYGFQLGVSQISLRVVELSQVKVFVLGNVNKPSAYVLQGNSSILNALYMAGGPTDFGSVRNIQVMRGTRKKNLDLYDYLIKGKLPKHHIVRDGDVIFLPKSEKLVEVKGAVKKPAIYELKQKEGFQELLEFGQGAKSNASPFASILTHDSLGQAQLKDVEILNAIQQKLSLKDGDEVELKENTETAQDVVTLMGNVQYPGQFSWESSLRLDSLIDKAGGTKHSSYLEAIEVFRLQEDKSYQLVLNQYQPEFELMALDSVYLPSHADFKVKEMVAVSGAVRNQTEVDYFPGISLKNIIIASGGVLPNWKKGKVTIERRVPNETKLELHEHQLKVDANWSEFEALKLDAGDRVIFKVDPNFYQQELVSIKGRGTNNPGSYALAYKGETLGKFFQRVVKVTESVQWDAIRFTRLRGDKKHLIAINFKEILNGGEGSDIRLRNGDEIYIPDQEFTVQVLGEVISPGDVLYRPKADYEDYLSWAGGVTRFGDEDKVLITFPNGARVKADDYDGVVPPGSIIVVSYKPVEPPINWTAFFTGTLSAVGSIASVLLTVVIINEKL